MTTEVKSLAPIKRRITTVSKQVEGYVITSAEDLTVATDTLSIIKTISKDMESHRKGRVDPLNAEVKAINAEYKPLSADLGKAEDYIKGEMLKYQEEVDRKAAEEAAKLEARVEKGTMRVDTAMRKMDDIETVGTSVKGARGSVQFRTTRDVEIENPSAVPLRYLADEKVIAAIKAAVRKDALSGVEIPGVKVIEKKGVAAS